MSAKEKHNPKKENGCFKRKTASFTMIPRSVVDDKRLSLGAKGLYALIQYYVAIPDFTLHKSFLRTLCKDGEYSFDSCWKNLVQNEYLTVTKENTYYGFVYEYDLKDSLYEDSPDPDFPGMGNPDLGSPDLGNWGTNNIDKRKSINSIESISDDDCVLDLERIHQKLDQRIQIEKQRAAEMKINIQEIDDASEALFKALHAIKDPNVIKAVNSASPKKLYRFWHRIYCELFDTSAFDGPERSVGNKIGYVIEMIKNEFH